MSLLSTYSPPQAVLSPLTVASQASDAPSASPAGGAPVYLPRGMWLPGWQAIQSGVVSAILHAVTLIVLGIATVAPEKSQSAGMVVAQMHSVGDDALTVEEAAMAVPVRVDLQFASALRAGDPDRPMMDDLAPAAGVSDTVRDLRHTQWLTGMSENDDGGMGDGTTIGGGLGGLADVGETSGGGQADNNGAKSASFFGIEAGGKSFVFVVDLSGSMAGHRFRFAKAELRRSLEKLASDQRYYIVFFNTVAFPMPAANLLNATTQNRAKTARWISQMQTGGFTNPWPALQVAMELEPDAIFFLTDGEFDPMVVERIEPASTSDSTPIHTIAFQSRDGEELLKAIARKTRGTYRFVK